jgi:hypothetical protein
MNRGFQGICIAAVLWFGAAPAGAIVRRISAVSESRVQSFVGGAADSMDEAFEEFGPDSGTSIPIGTRAELEAFDGAQPVSAALAASGVDDPTRATPGRNPEELSLEASCASDDADESDFDVESTVRETRLVRFSAAELGNPIDGTRLVQSAIFPSGAVFLWSSDGSRDLTGLGAEMDIVIRRVPLSADGQEGDAEELLRLSVALQGGPAGAVNESSSPGLSTLVVDVTALPAIPGLPLGDVSGLAVARALIIPDGQTVSYEYDATVDVEFLIEAEVTATVSNLSGGTGVVSVFGRSFGDAARIIEIGVSPGTAKALEARLNKAMTTFASVRSPGGLCGAMGVESAMVLIVPVGWAVVPRWNRRRVHDPARRDNVDR